MARIDTVQKVRDAAIYRTGGKFTSLDVYESEGSDGVWYIIGTMKTVTESVWKKYVTATIMRWAWDHIEGKWVVTDTISLDDNEVRRLATFVENS